MGKIIRDGNVISTYNYEKTVDQSDFITMITRPDNANIVVPEGVEKIGDYAFDQWRALREVSLPNTLTNISASAFAHCDYLTFKGNVLPESVNILGDSCFSGCSRLVLNKFPSRVTVIPNYCFYNCWNLTGYMDLSNVTKIGSWAFSSTKISSVTLSEELLALPSECFRSTNLVTITIPSKISEIPSSCFTGCNLLEQIFFNGDINTIKSSSFYGCTSLSQFDLRNNTAVPTLYSVAALGHASGCKIVIPNSLYDTWTTATNWSGLTDVQWIRVINSWDDTITAEGDYVLMSDLDLTDIRHLNPSAPVTRAPGLYKTGAGEIIKTWEQLISDKDILFDSGKYGIEFSIINKSLEGDLIVGTGEVEGLYSTFSKCNNLTYIDLSGLTLGAESNNMSGIFADCVNLQGVKFNETFNTSRVVNMSNLFNGDNKITSIDLSMFNTSNVTDMSYAFNCENLKHLDISNFDFTNVVEKTAMFANTPTTCEILVKDETAKNWMNTNFPEMTNVKVKGA